MRSVLLSLLFLPLFAGAQINRSAKEFASERIGDYITGKLFKDLSYQPVSFGELMNHEDKDLDIAWTIEHKFVITDTEFADKKTAVHTSYKFLFYLDRQMKVKKAETFISN
ncbi:MAG: hypothetical protein Q8941_10675 [Bacteroidota bacterium]|nr:hypothetical protein [Bacteroidota bacterium]